MDTPTDPESTDPDFASEPGKDASTEEIEADIARTRERLGHTVDELSGKLDVKSQARARIRAAKARATERATAVRETGRKHAARAADAVSDDGVRPNRAVPAGAALAAVAIAATVMRIRRRSR